MGRLTNQIAPRIVSIYELRKTLMPLMVGIPSAEDDLMDLWRMGAPDPSPQSQACPSGVCKRSHVLGLTPCGKWGCANERRVLLPQQFAAWWEAIARRQGLALTAEEALSGRKN